MYSLKNTQNINQLVNYSFLFKMFLRNSYYVYTCVPQHGGCGGMSWYMEVAWQAAILYTTMTKPY